LASKLKEKTIVGKNGMRTAAAVHGKLRKRIPVSTLKDDRTKRRKGT